MANNRVITESESERWTVWEKFAAAALPGVIRRGLAPRPPQYAHEPEALATQACDIADAMMVERKRRIEGDAEDESDEQDSQEDQGDKESEAAE